MYCGMPLDARDNVVPLCSDGRDDSPFVWSDEASDKMKKKDGKLITLQLDTIAYLWEMCYDCLLANSNNVPASPGFEVLGLRVNHKRKKLIEQISLW